MRPPATDEQRTTYRKKLAREGADHVPTETQRDQVKALMFADTPLEVIARLMGIKTAILRWKYKNEIKWGKAEVAAKLKMNLVSKAVAGDKGVLGALARAMRLGAEEKPSEPVRQNARPPREAERPAFDVSGLTDANLAEILATLEQGSDPPHRPRRARAA